MAPGVALLIAVALTSLGAARATGDEATVGSGARVRVVALGVSAKPFVGQLVASDEKTLTIIRSNDSLLRPGWPFRREPERETLVLPRASVTRFEHSVRPSRKRLGATIGGLVAIAAGGVVIAKETGGDCAQCGLPLFVAAVPFALLGAAIAPGDRWAPEDPRNVRVGFTARGGAGVRLSVAF